MIITLFILNQDKNSYIPYLPLHHVTNSLWVEYSYKFLVQVFHASQY